MARALVEQYREGDGLQRPHYSVVSRTRLSELCSNKQTAISVVPNLLLGEDAGEMPAFAGRYTQYLPDVNTWTGVSTWCGKNTKGCFSLNLSTLIVSVEKSMSWVAEGSEGTRAWSIMSPTFWGSRKSLATITICIDELNHMCIGLVL